jgi:hypothetical protein
VDWVFCETGREIYCISTKVFEPMWNVHAKVKDT